MMLFCLPLFLRESPGLQVICSICSFPPFAPFPLDAGHFMAIIYVVNLLVSNEPATGNESEQEQEEDQDDVREKGKKIFASFNSMLQFILAR